MIEMEHVSFVYENAVRDSALKNIQVEIPKGQVVLLCGESGSGKTTFGRLVNGLIPNYYEGCMEGCVTVDGKDIRETQLYELAPIAGSVFQNPKSQFYTLLTDTEIVFACENIGLAKEDILNRFDRTVEALHIEDLIGKSLFTLSGGEKQKIACASVDALMPELFVLDEPTSNLDIGAICDLRAILSGWKAQGKTIVIAEHRLAWLQGIADRVLYFKDGSLAGDFEADFFWKKQTAELHHMGLRADSGFVPQCRSAADIQEWLEFQNFRFAVKGEELLHIDHLEIPKGAVVAVLGNNGAGKTTFARCLCGLEKKTDGILRCHGKTFTGRQRIRLCYMVMQDVNHQLFTESVLDEVLLGMEDLPEKERISNGERILSELDLLEYKDAHPMSLSGGQRQRAAIAGAVVSRKEIIIFDEPTSGLDYRHMKEAAESIRKLSEMGKTQFIITHDPELTAKCCDYFIFIEDGRVARCGSWTPENIRFADDYFHPVQLGAVRLADKKEADRNVDSVK